MRHANLRVHPAFAIGDIDPRIYSGFIEHLGRAVYEGIYFPDCPAGPDAVDEEGWHKGAMALVKALDMPLTRYPGGNFVSGYNWEDGVGPREQRPVRLDLAWSALEPNTIGTDEFVRWCRKANTAPMMAVNLGTRGAAEAQALVEYCNHPGGTAWSDRRRANGAEQPHAIKTWCLGNEMDGPWQTGHKGADEYGLLAREAAKMMKGTDPSIELVVCGSSHFGMDTFGVWEEKVIEHTGDVVDYLSLHQYFGNGDKRGILDYCAQADRMGRFIEAAVATCDAVCARKRWTKRIMLSVDEWNVWYHSHGLNDQDPKNTVARRLLEDVYDMADVLVNGCALNELMNHADRVKIACIAQSVNVIAPVMVDQDGRAWRQTIYWPQFYAAKYGRGVALRTVVDAPAAALANPGHGDPKEASLLSSAVALNGEELAVFAINRDAVEDMALTVALDGFASASVLEHVEVAHPDLAAVNSADGETVAPAAADRASVADGALTVRLKPASWNMVRVRVAR